VRTLILMHSVWERNLRDSPEPDETRLRKHVWSG
jgi:hypothetical protein